MTSIDLKLKLSDALARDADAAGLLRPEEIERLLRDELRRRRMGEFVEHLDRAASSSGPPLTSAEIEAEIDAVRAQRRGGDARRR